MKECLGIRRIQLGVKEARCRSNPYICRKAITAVEYGQFSRLNAGREADRSSLCKEGQGGAVPEEEKDSGRRDQGSHLL